MSMDSQILKELQNLNERFLAFMREQGGNVARAAVSGRRSSYIGRSPSRSNDEIDIDALQTEIKSLAKQLGETEDSFKDIESINKLLHRRFAGVAEVSTEHARVLNILNDIIESSHRTIEDLDDGAEEASYNLWKFARGIDSNTTASRQFETSLAKTAATSASFAAALFANSTSLSENTELYDAVTKDIRDSSKNLHRGILQAANVYDAISGQLKSSMMKNDFANLHVSVANISATIDDAAGKMQLKNGIGELLNYTGSTEANNRLSSALSSDNPDFKAGIDSLVMRLKAAGVDITGIFEDGRSAQEQYSDAIKEIVSIYDNNKESLEVFNVKAFEAGTELGGLVIKVKHASAAMQDWVDSNITSSDAIRQNAADFGTSISRIVDQLQDFNIAMLPETFMDVQMKAIEMGMTFEETAQFLQANKSLYAMQGGAAEFEALREQLMDAYGRQGFNQKQAASMMASDIELAKSGGVDIRDPKILSNFVEETARGFKNLSSVIAITHEEYVGALESINSSTEMSAALYGLDEQRANSLRLSNAAQYENYRLMGLSNEQAQALTQAAARRNREGIASKFADAARTSLLASQTGMDPEKVRRLQQLSMKSYIAPGSQEEKELVALRQELGQNIEKTRQSAADSSDPRHAMVNETINTLMGGLSQDAQSQIETGLTTGMRERSNAQISQDEKEAMAAEAEPSQAARVLTDWTNSFKALMDNSFVAALFSGTAAVIGLALSAVKASIALNKLGGGGLGGLTDFLPGRGRGGARGGGRGPRPTTGRGSKEDVMARRQMGREGRTAGGFNTHGATGPGVNALESAAPTKSVTQRVLNPKNLLKGGLVGAAVGIGGGLLVDGLASTGAINEEQAQLANTGMDVAGWAGTGAAIGSVVPGIGTAIGAGVGGLAGLAMNWDEGGKDLVQGFAKYGTPMGWMAGMGEKTAGLTDSIFGTNTQDTLAGINQSIFGSRFTEPDSPASTPSPQEVRQQAQQDQPASESVVNKNALSALGPEGLDPIQTLIQQLGPEKLAEAFAAALAGVRITMYNPNSATTSLGYISGRQSS